MAFVPLGGLSGSSNSFDWNDMASNLDEYPQKVAKEIGNSYSRLESVGEDTQVPRQDSILTSLFRNLSRTGMGANQALDALITHQNPWDAYKKGFSLEEPKWGKDIAHQRFGISDQPLFNANLAKPINWLVQKATGHSPDYHVDISPSKAGMAGLAMDVMNPLDALNWVLPGIGKATMRGGKTGLELVEHTMGKGFAGKLAENFGEDVISKLTARRAGDLSNKVDELISGAIRRNSLDPKVGKELLDSMNLGFDELGRTARTRIPGAQEHQRLALDIQLPIFNTSLGKLELPFTSPMVSGAKILGEKFANSALGDSLGSMFNTAWTKKLTPNSVLVNKLRGPDIPKVMEPDLAQLIRDVQHGIGQSAEKNLYEASGKEELKGFKRFMIDLFGPHMKSLEKTFTASVENVFKQYSASERKAVMEAAATGAEVSEKLKPAVDFFTNWRDALVKQYQQTGISVKVLDKYVPFVVIGGRLTKSEAQLLKNRFGISMEGGGEVGDDIATKVARAFDPHLNPRKFNAPLPSSINRVLGREWLSEDAAIAMAMRGVKGIRGVEASKLMDMMLQKYGVDPKEFHHIPAGYIPVTARKDSSGKSVLSPVTTAEALAKTEGDAITMLPQEFVNAFNESMDLFFNPKAANEVLKLFDQLTHWFRTTAYLWNPGHIPRDFMSNVYLGWLMGIRNPMTYAKGMHLMINPENKFIPILKSQIADPIMGHFGKLSKEDIPDGIRVSVNKNGEMVANDRSSVVVPKTIFDAYSGTGYTQMSARHLMDLLDSHGIFSGASYIDTARSLEERLAGFGKMELPKSGKDLLKLPLKPINAYTNVMNAGTRSMDDYSRLVATLDQLGKGKNFDEAVTNVKKFYFDYSDLTPTEWAWMRRIIPFYTWMRKNIPLQLEQAVRQPGKLATMAKISHDATGGDVPSSEEMPAYIEENAGIRLPGKEGNRNYVISPFPYQDFARIPTDRKSLSKLASNVNPLLRAIPELAMGKEFFSGRDIEQYKGQREKVPIVSTLEKLYGMEPSTMAKYPTGYALNQIPFLRNLGVISDPENIRQLPRLLSFVGGPQVYAEKSAQTAAVYEERDRLRDLLRMLKGDEGIDVPTVRELNKKPNISQSMTTSQRNKILGGGGL